MNSLRFLRSVSLVLFSCARHNGVSVGNSDKAF
jgi:hypothetical protein